MESFQDKLKKIRAFVFDVDGVLSKDTTPLNAKGDPVRTANVKDGFAIRFAIREGFQVVVITGGNAKNVKPRYRKLGVKHYFENISDKATCLQNFIKRNELLSEHVLYMGDDLVDYKAMAIAGIPACPGDAVPEIKRISKYVSAKNGGEGCARDAIELVLKAQEKWIDSGETDIRAF